MEEKQNCSESPISNNPVARRRASLSTLSRIFKTQTSSIQHRACPEIKTKPKGGSKFFLIKALIGGGAIYLTALLGVWGEADESTKMYSKIKQAINQIDNEKMISSNVKADLYDKIIKSKEFLKGHLEHIPGEMKVYYEKSEKFFNDLMKGKKS